MNNSQINSSLASAVVKLRLPHPYLSTYQAVPVDAESQQWLRIKLIDQAMETPSKLHNDSLQYLSLQDPEQQPDQANNSAWANARRTCSTAISWEGSEVTLAHIWLVVYMIFTQSSSHEAFRLVLKGSNQSLVAHSLERSTLAIRHPKPSRTSDMDREDGTGELLILRSAFWQGAASPFGERSIWIPSGGGSSNVTTTDYTMTTKTPDFNQVHAWHPRRAAKPSPGTMVYSRWIPSLDEHFSMIALDYTNPEHLNLFHTWQNDPRVAAGWNETGSLEHHRNYLKHLHDDPHVLTVLAYWDETPFGYYEIYWAAEDHIGAHYQAQDFDRGRHALVGNANFRGRHRVTAWWSATM